MFKKGEKIFVIVAATLVLFALYFIPLSQGYLGLLFDVFTEPNWDEVHERYIVKNAIPINLIEQTNGKCKVTAHYFDSIINHRYFIRGKELANELQYDTDNETIMLPCDILEDEKSELNIWYVKEESPRHSNKYQYFVTTWSETSS